MTKWTCIEGVTTSQNLSQQFLKFHFFLYGGNSINSIFRSRAVTTIPLVTSPQLVCTVYHSTARAFLPLFSKLC